MYKFDETVKGSMDNINDLTMRLIREFSKFLDDEKTLYDLRLIVTELVVNGVRHGNMDDFDKLIRLCATLADEKIIISVKDQGKGFKNIEYSCRDFSKTNGRGLFIVEHIADRIIYNNNEVVVELHV
ncbi:MAG: ATP-binding protein [Lagierella massiliensis]|nr:ATP-binding protein [Lagierella massiliensis]